MRAEQVWNVELEQRVKGAPETVFEYFTDPEKYSRWQGVEAELDARPGGIFKVTTAPDVRARGKYVAVEPPRRILLTWDSRAPGRRSPAAWNRCRRAPAPSR